MVNGNCYLTISTIHPLQNVELISNFTEVPQSKGHSYVCENSKNCIERVKCN